MLRTVLARSTFAQNDLEMLIISGMRMTVGTRWAGLQAESGRFVGPDRARLWGASVHTLASGHRLGLRVISQGARDSVRLLWHGTPDGEWRAYLDGTLTERFAGSACGRILRDAMNARIMRAWPRNGVLHVRVDAPALDWTLRLSDSNWPGRSLFHAIAVLLGRTPPIVHDSLALVPVDRPHAGRADWWASVRLANVGPVADATASLDGVDLGRALPVQRKDRRRSRRDAIVVGWLAEATFRSGGAQ
jgi:hypothetical protein